VRWTFLTYAVGKLVTLLATVVLARMLVPADFGVVMLAFSAINVVGLFGDLGLGATLVVRRDLDRRGLGTALSMLILSGVALTVLLVAAAPFLSHAFHAPRLQAVLIVLAPLSVISSVNWFYQWLLQRELEFRQRFYGFMAQTGAYAAVAVLSAAFGAGVWSIVAGHFAGQVAMSVLFVIVAPRVRPAWERGLAADLLRTSRGFLLQTGARLLQGEADYVAVGRTLGATPLGLYSMAFRLGELPYLAIADPVAKVTFPTFTRMRARDELVASQYRDVLRNVALVTCPMGVGMSAVAAPLALVVYGQRWAGMAGALTALGVWGAVRCVQSTAEWLLNSAGGANRAGVLAAVLLAVQAPLLFVAARAGGIAAVGWVLAGGALTSVIVLAALNGQAVGIGALDHWRALWPVAAAGIGTWIAARATASLVSDPPFAALALSVAAGAVAYVALVSVLAHGSLQLATRYVRRSFAGEPGERAAAGPSAEKHPGEGASV
jgi:PST family polysaccharide transporter